MASAEIPDEHHVHYGADGRAQWTTDADRGKPRTDAKEEAVKALHQTLVWARLQLKEKKMKDLAKAAFWLVGGFLLLMYGVVGLIMWIIAFFVGL